MTNHTTIALALPGALVLFALHRGRPPGHLRILWMDIGIAGAAALAPLSLYLLLVARGSPGSYPSLWDTSTLQALWTHVSGGYFKSFFMAMPEDWLVSRMLAVRSLLLSEFGVHGFALAMAGVWTMLHRDSGLALFGVILSLLTFVFAVSYPVPDSQIYFLPLFLFLALCCGWGAATVDALSAPWLTGRRRRPSWLLLLLALLLPAAQYLGNRQSGSLWRARGVHRRPAPPTTWPPSSSPAHQPGASTQPRRPGTS